MVATKASKTPVVMILCRVEVTANVGWEDRLYMLGRFGIFFLVAYLVSSFLAEKNLIRERSKVSV
jgi:hypothetical protein